MSGEEKKQLARPRGSRKGIQYCERAIEKDPDYALAHAGLSDCCGVMSAIGVGRPELFRARAKAAAQRAVESDDTLAEAHNALAYARAYCDWDWKGSEATFRHALELNPALWITHDWYALTLGCLGRLDEALAQNRRALELEPLSVVLYHHAAWLTWLARRYDAVELSRKTIELDEGFGDPRFDPLRSDPRFGELLRRMGSRGETSG